MTDELKRPTLLGGSTAVYAQVLDPRNSDPSFDEKQRAAQEIMSRQYHKARQSMQDQRTRTLEQHAVYLSTFGTGDADYAAKRAYMLKHGLEYIDGVLGYAPSTVHREAAWEAKQRLGQAVVEQYKTTTAQQAESTLSALVPHVAPGKMFSRETIVAILRADRARYMAGLRIAPVPDCPAEATVVNDLITVFENLE